MLKFKLLLTVALVAIFGQATLTNVAAEENEANYTVEYWVQSAEEGTTADGNSWDNKYSKKSTVTLSGTVGETITKETEGVLLEDMEGFELSTLTNTKRVVKENGKTVFKVYYNRIEYDVTYNEAGGSQVSNINDVKYGSTITLASAPSKAYATFMHWIDNDGNIYEANQIITMPVNGLKLTAVYDQTYAGYQVVYMIQAAQEGIAEDGNDWDQKWYYETVDRTAPIGTIITRETEGVLLENPEGLYLSEMTYKQRKVSANGKMDFYVYYYRHEYDITFNENGGSDVTDIIAIKYESPITLADAPVKENATFTHWVDANGNTYEANQKMNMPVDGLELTAVYEEHTPTTNTTFTVEYWIQSEIEGSYDGTTSWDNKYTHTNSVTLGANAGDVVTRETEGVLLENMDGFELSSSTNTKRTVKENGKTVFKVYYNRAEYNVTYDENGGSEVTDIIEIKYESQITLAEAPVKANATFLYWEDAKGNTYTANQKIAMPLNGLTLTAVYEESEVASATYVVNHYFKNSRGGYDLKETETLTGEVGTTLELEALAKCTECSYLVTTEANTTVVEDNSLVIDLYYDNNDYMITFDEESTGIVRDEYFVASGMEHTLTVFEKEGFVFEYWFYINSKGEEVILETPGNDIDKMYTFIVPCEAVHLQIKWSLK